ncbi:MAG: hypothetical protein KC517_05895 [Bacteroidetes bacterium]|jgi:hypothetical protein|nr:hypothetical protein [Bacteroidota bacterium]
MHKLKKYLLMNSAFSAISGLALVFMSDAINALFNIDNSIVLPAIGINLLVFSLIVYYVAIKLLKRNSLVTLISALDILWVIGSAVIVVFQLFNLSTAGYIVIGLVAIWIGFLGSMQIKYNKGN